MSKTVCRYNIVTHFFVQNDLEVQSILTVLGHLLGDYFIN